MTITLRRLRALACLLAVGALLPSCFVFGGDDDGDGNPGGDGGPPTYDADLEIGSLTFSPLQVDAGQSILATDVVRNTGEEAVPAFRVGVYLSPDPAISTSDVLLGFRTVPGLDPGAQDAGGGELTIPLQTTAGVYWVGAIADDLDEVGEQDEDNNVTAGPDTLNVDAPLLPDLIPTVVTFTPAVVDAGETIQVDDVIENQGQSSSGAFQAGVYLSSDAIVTTADTLLGIRQISDLAPSSGDQGSGIVTVPSSTPAGIYYVGVIADDTDAVFESSEVNNSGVAGSTLEVTVPPLPDLVPTHVTFQPTSVDAGDQILVAEGVLNQGQASADTFQVGVYLSADSLVDGTDVLLGFRSIAFLSDGEDSKVENLPLEIPPDTPAGTYWIGVWADDTELIPESIEANNTLVAVSTLSVDVPPLPNLRPISVEFSPNVINIDDGELLSISEVVENAGSAASGAFRVGFYLSPNSVVTPSDVLISSRVITTLSPGASSGSSKQVQLPNGLSDGSYFVGVIADDLSEQGEVSEGDNLLIASGILDVVSTPDPEPNLIMQECSYTGHNKAPGATFQVVSKVTNDGDLSAPPFHVGIYLSTDSTITPDDVLLGDRNVLAGLSAGFSNVASAPVTIPADQAEGIYYVGAYADIGLVVAESDEEDNDYTSPGTLEVEVPPPPAPELYVKSASHDGGTHSPGDTVNLDDVVRNMGELDAGEFRVGYYLSPNEAISANDVRLATRVITALDAGAEDSASTPLVIPAGTAPGEYWLGVLVDDQDVITENDEDDNDKNVAPKIKIQ